VRGATVSAEFTVILLVALSALAEVPPGGV